MCGVRPAPPGVHSRSMGGSTSGPKPEDVSPKDVWPELASQSLDVDARRCQGRFLMRRTRILWSRAPDPSSARQTRRNFVWRPPFRTPGLFQVRLWDLIRALTTGGRAGGGVGGRHGVRSGGRSELWPEVGAHGPDFDETRIRGRRNTLASASSQKSAPKEAVFVKFRAVRGSGSLTRLDDPSSE